MTTAIRNFVIKPAILGVWLVGYCSLLLALVPIGMLVSLRYQPFRQGERDRWDLDL
jgi:hypothetical protein